jgi:hypothetical protein
MTCSLMTRESDGKRQASLGPPSLPALFYVTTREIAQILGISVKTVETHRSQLMEALDLHDVAGVVRYAIRSGVIEPHN